MRLGLVLAALGLAAAAATPALAATSTVQQLLDEGFVIVGTDVVPIDVVKRAMNEDWLDDYFLTLQKENRIAFCHATLASTTDATGFGDVSCTVSDGSAAPSKSPQPRLPRPPQ